MPIDRPTAAELLSAVQKHLAENLAPLLQGQPAFHLQVAINALAIVERTMAEGNAMNQAELNRLRELLGREGDLLELNRLLSAKIKAGEWNNQKEAILAHLRQTVVDKLRLANPRHTITRD